MPFERSGLNFELTSIKDFNRVFSMIYKLKKHDKESLKRNVEELYKILDNNQEVIKKDYLNLVKEL